MQISLVFVVQNDSELQKATRLLQYMTLTGVIPDVDEIRKLQEQRDSLAEEIKQLEARKVAIITTAAPVPVQAQNL